MSVDAGGVLTYSAAAGHINIVSFTQSGSPTTDVTVTRTTSVGFLGGQPDDDPLVNGAGCDAPTTSGTAPAPTFQSVVCHGVSSVVANASDKDDTVTANGLNTIPITINAGDGNDTLVGGQADAGDTLNGENGNDNVDGLNGPDKISGGAGDDGTAGGLDGEQGNDTIDGGPGNDAIADTGVPTSPAPATPGVNDTSNDTLTGGEGSDSINGGAGDDSIDGGDGSDGTLAGGLGADTVSGGNGDDFVQATEDNTADTYNGGAGNDTIDYSTYGSDLTIALTGGKAGSAGDQDNLAADFENANGGAGNDTLTGTDADNQLSGNGGNDTVNGAGGNDSLSGGSGNDTLNGGDGRDNLSGDDGNDVLNGNAGDDDLQGWSGDDLFNGGDGTDTADYSGYGANVSVSLDGTANDGQSGETDNADADHSVENVLTGFGDDTITASKPDVDFVDSGGGNDVVNVTDGTLASDIVSCGTGYDSAAGDVLDAFDRTGLTRCENVPKATFKRVAPKVTAKITPKSDKKAPFKFTTKGKIVPPAVIGTHGCTGFVSVQVKAGANTISTRRVKVNSACNYSSTVTLHVKKRFFGHNKLRFFVRFTGNRYLSAVALKVKHVSVG